LKTGLPFMTVCGVVWSNTKAVVGAVVDVAAFQSILTQVKDCAQVVLLRAILVVQIYVTLSKFAIVQSLACIV
jgi:hypothetical protein